MAENATSALSVAAAQFRSSGDLGDNLERMRSRLEELAGQGVRVAAFPECAVTSYDARAIAKFAPEDLEAAERALMSMCREHGIYAVVGTPYYEDGALYNGALAIDPDGRLIARYAKIQLAEAWPVPGKRLVLFAVDGVLCSIIICHDERYPELVRLPALAGAQVVFYLSCESDVTHETKLAPYRAQIQARAEENTVYIVQSNAPQTFERRDDGAIVLQAGCSHGQSRIIAPDGNLLREASIFREEVLVESLDLGPATRHLALRSAQSELLGGWWNAGVELVRRSDADQR